MTGRLHHIAIHSENFVATVGSVQSVSRAQGERPDQKVWFRQGTQVDEVFGKE